MVSWSYHDLPAHAGETSMKDILRYLLTFLSGLIATAFLLSVVMVGILGLEFCNVVQKLNSQVILYVFPALILFEFCFFTNDLLVYLSESFHVDVGLQFSEMRFI